MKNKRPYRLTETGIRISKHKIKWMKSPKDNQHKDKNGKHPRAPQQRR